MTSEALAYYEHEWQLERDLRIETAEDLNQALADAERLRRSADEHRRHAVEVEARLREVEAELETLHRTVERLERREGRRRRQCAALLHRVTEAEFWTQEMLAPLARELDGIQLVAQLTDAEGDGSAGAEPEVNAVLAEVGAKFRELGTSFDPGAAAWVRRAVLAQWILIRWLELSTPDEGGVD